MGPWRWTRHHRQGALSRNASRPSFAAGPRSLSTRQLRGEFWGRFSLQPLPHLVSQVELAAFPASRAPAVNRLARSYRLSDADPRSPEAEALSRKPWVQRRPIDGVDRLVGLARFELASSEHDDALDAATADRWHTAESGSFFEIKGRRKRRPATCKSHSARSWPSPGVSPLGYRPDRSKLSQWVTRL